MKQKINQACLLIASLLGIHCVLKITATQQKSKFSGAAPSESIAAAAAAASPVTSKSFPESAGK